MLYAGSKKKYARSIAKEIAKKLDYDNEFFIEYYEPFVGGNNVYFAIKEELKANFKNVVWNDINKDIITIHQKILEYPNWRHFLATEFCIRVYDPVYNVHDLRLDDIVSIPFIYELPNEEKYKQFMKDLGKDPERFILSKKVLDDMVGKDGYNEYLKNPHIPEWKKILVSSILNFSGVTFVRDTTCTVNHDCSGGIKKFFSSLKSLISWIIKLKETAFYDPANIFLLNEDYTTIINKYIAFTRPFIGKIVYLDPPYQEKTKNGLYDFVGDKTKFFENVEKLAYDNYCEVFLSEAAELDPSKWEKLREWKTKVNEQVYRTEYLYHLIKKDLPNENK